MSIIHKYLLVIGLIFSFHLLVAQHSQVKKGRVPEWVNPIANLEPSVDNVNGSYYYLLLDFQTHVEREENYRHVSILAKNSEGLQQISDLSFDFDPTYQKITFHHINLIREGQVIEKLNLTEAKIIQREQNADRYLYDGNLSVVFNLTDTRVGDVLDYSFTISGFNPVYANQYTSYFNLNYSDPVDQIYKRLLIDNSRGYDVKSVNNSPEPTSKTQGHLRELVWNLKNVKQVMYDTNVPIWFEGQQSYHISEFKTWKEVVDWAVPLYIISSKDKKKLYSQAKKLKAKGDTKEAHILKIIRFVQDEVRYLGFESGLNTMTPYSPSIVLDQRFGDCKDKSLLLVGLLQSIGVDANPMLVHSSKGKGIPDKLPSPNVFDHCVVEFEFGNRTISIDPTIQNQGGKLDYMAFPDYKFGLSIRKENSELRAIEFLNPPEIIIQELIKVNKEGDAEFTVRSEYFGSKADFMRSYYLNNNLADINNEYVNYYSGLYPTIQSSRDVKFLDYERNTSNKLIVEEYYNLDNIWRYTEDSSRQYFEIFPLVLDASINYPKSAERSMPYYIGDIETFFQKSTISMYEDWGATPTTKSVENSAFEYSSLVSSKGNEILIDYNYRTKANFVAASEVRKIVEDANSMSNDLSFYIYKGNETNGFELSLFNTSGVVLIFVASIYIVRKLDTSDLLNPLPPSDRLSEEAFGGWLLIIMIGIAVTPFYQAYTVFSEATFFNSVVLDQLRNNVETLPLYMIIEFELFISMAFFCFSCYFAYCFFSKRTNIPLLASIFYSTSFLILVLDFMLLETFVPENLTDSERTSSLKEIFKSVVVAAIWIPYFYKSTRVKKTFVRTPLLPKAKY